MLPAAAAANVAPLKDSYLFPHSVHSAHYTKFMQKCGTTIKTFYRIYIKATLILISGLKTDSISIFEVVLLICMITFYAPKSFFKDLKKLPNWNDATMYYASKVLPSKKYLLVHE